MMSKLLYCDLDSTLNNHWKRIKNNSKNGIILPSAFSREEIMKDDATLYASMAIRKFHQHGWKIVILTARDFKDAHDITTEWLARKQIYYDDVVCVSSGGDKINYWMKNKSDLFIDDFMGGQEHRHPKFNHKLYSYWLDVGAIVEVFRNNWKEIVERVLS